MRHSSTAPNEKRTSSRFFLALAALILTTSADPLFAWQANTEPNPVSTWLSLEAVRLHTVEPESGLADLQPLKQIVGNSQIVAFGEPTHGNREVFRLKHRVFEFLVEEMGFSVFALEAPLPESFDINEYVLTGKGNPAQALAGITMWAWDTEEVLSVIEWMRQYNQDPANTQKLTFYGFDMQAPERAARVTLDYLAKVDSPLAEAAHKELGSLAIPFSDPESFGWRPDIESEGDASSLKTVRMVLGELDSRRRDYIALTSGREWGLVRQHAQILASFVEASAEGGREWDRVRDRTMAENLRWIIDRERRGTKVFVWAHNSHVANATIARWGNVDTAGLHLRRMFGENLLLIGTLFDRGEFAALDAASKELRTFLVGAAPDDSVEAKLEGAGLNVALVDLRRLPDEGPVAEWFAEPRRTRHSGGGYDEATPERSFMEYLLPEAFDVLAFVRTTTATKPVNPTDYDIFPTLAAPANLDFERCQDGEPPEGWIAWSKILRSGFLVTTTKKTAFSGRCSAMVSRPPGQHPGEMSGSLVQRVDAAPYRGRKIRLRAIARAEIPRNAGMSFLRMKIEPVPSMDVHSLPDLMFDSLDEKRVSSKGWRTYQIIATVPESAVVISYGLFLTGFGTVWLDDVRVESIEP